jgi:hypothetical protein
MPKILRRIGHFLHVGWHVVTELHTVQWIILGAAPALPGLLISAATKFWGEHSAFILVLTFILSFGVVSLLGLGVLGYQSEVAGFSDTDAWDRIRRWWGAWLSLGVIGGVGLSLWVAAISFPDTKSLQRELDRLLKQNDSLSTHLKYLITDRHLNMDTKNALSAFLAKHKGNVQNITIASLGTNCTDCGGYADDFADAFKTAGWSFARVNYMDLNPAIKGVLIVVHDKNTPPPSAITMRDALIQANILNAGIQSWDKLKEGEVNLIVMPKPRE